MTKFSVVRHSYIVGKIMGIRPSEKLHEIMCPSGDSYLTCEYDEYYVIKPPIIFFNQEYDFSVSALDEKGKPVNQGFI